MIWLYRALRQLLSVWGDGVRFAGAGIAGVYVNLPRLFRAGPWLVVLASLLGLRGRVTVKLDLLSRPFFATPQSLLEEHTDDWQRLGESTLRACCCWPHPVLRLIGPQPATVWLPSAFYAFPSS